MRIMPSDLLSSQLDGEHPRYYSENIIKNAYENFVSFWSNRNMTRWRNRADENRPWWLHNLYFSFRDAIKSPTSLIAPTIYMIEKDAARGHIFVDKRNKLLFFEGKSAVIAGSTCVVRNLDAAWQIPTPNLQKKGKIASDLRDERIARQRKKIGIASNEMSHLP